MRRVTQALLAAATVLAPAAANAECKLLQSAEFHVDPQSRIPVVDGQLNGSPVRIMLDTGSSYSTIYRREATRLGLPLTRLPGFEIGGGTGAYQARINQLRIGDATKLRFNLIVASDPDDAHGVTMILGNDFLSQADVEFDLPDGVVRLFNPVGCAPAQLVYWSPASYSQATLLPWPLEWPSANIMAMVNGQPVRASLDTGSYTSAIDSGKAAALGVANAGATGNDPRGNGPHEGEGRIGRFDSIAIGDEQISHARLPIVDLSRSTPAETQVADRGADAPSMLIGADFFHSHRVFFDYADHLVLFSYQGGSVFQPALAANGH